VVPFVETVNKYSSMPFAFLKSRSATPLLRARKRSGTLKSQRKQSFSLMARTPADMGKTAFFYDAAEGLLTATILLIAEFCPPKHRHIVSVFKIGYTGCVTHFVQRLWK